MEEGARSPTSYPFHPAALLGRRSPRKVSSVATDSAGAAVPTCGRLSSALSGRGGRHPAAPALCPRVSWPACARERGTRLEGGGLGLKGRMWLSGALDTIARGLSVFGREAGVEFGNEGAPLTSAGTAALSLGGARPTTPSREVWGEGGPFQRLGRRRRTPDPSWGTPRRTATPPSPLPRAALSCQAERAPDSPASP